MAEAKAARRRGTGQEVSEYVDTSAYESYEKQEGDFVEPGAEPTMEQVLDTGTRAGKGAVGVGRFFASKFVRGRLLWTTAPAADPAIPHLF